MTERKAFYTDITESDDFITMPPSAQVLYFMLGMDTDKEGITKRPQSIMRLAGATPEDLNILIDRHFISETEPGMVWVNGCEDVDEDEEEADEDG